MERGIGGGKRKVGTKMDRNMEDGKVDEDDRIID